MPLADTLAEEVVLHLPLTPNAELRAVDALDRLLRRHQVEQRAAGQARFALMEACLNAIEYAQPSGATSAGTANMNVSIALAGGELHITVRNPGPFQAQSSQPRRGHGLKIIHSFMDRVRYLSDAQGTRVEMSKRV